MRVLSLSIALFATSSICIVACDDAPEVEGDVGVSAPDAPDTDEDGIPNAVDPCPFDYDPHKRDLDGDLIGDVCDPDVDGDDIPNEVDPDDDNDSIPDVEDPCLYFDGDTGTLEAMNADPETHDWDGDGVHNFCDDDVDGDGWIGIFWFRWNGDIWYVGQDNCPTVWNPDQLDQDGDGFGDACDECPHEEREPLNRRDGREEDWDRICRG